MTSTDTLQIQQIRLDRLLVSIFFYLITFLFTWLAFYFDLLKTNRYEVALVMVAICFILLIYYYLISSGINKSFYAPDLLFPQIMTGVFWITYFMTWTQELRGVGLLFYLSIVLLSAVFLNQRQLASLVFSILGAYALLIIYELNTKPQDFKLSINMIQWGVLASSMLAVMYVRFCAKKTQNHSSLRTKRLLQNQQQIKHEYETLKVMMEDQVGSSTKDNLTGLYNQRYFLHVANEYLQQKSHLDYLFCLCLVDIDQLKNINAQYGHIAGDEILKLFAIIIRKSVRREDIVARYQGGKFIILIPGAEQDKALDCAERLCHQYLHGRFEKVVHDLSLSVSIGVTIHHKGDIMENTLQRAYDSLEKAKANGQDQVCFLN